MAGMCTQNGSESRHNGGQSICGRVVSVLLPIPTFLKLCDHSTELEYKQNAEISIAREGIYRSYGEGKRGKSVEKHSQGAQEDAPFCVSFFPYVPFPSCKCTRQANNKNINEARFNSRSKQYVLSTARIAFTRG